MGSNRTPAFWAVFCALCFSMLSWTACGGGAPGTSSSPGTPSASFSISSSLSPITASPGTKIYISVQAAVSGTAAVPSITLGALPAGVTSTTTFPLVVPANGARFDLEIAANAAIGTFTVPINGSAGNLSAATSVALTVSSQPMNPAFLAQPFYVEYQVAQGSSVTIQSQVTTGSLYAIDLSVAGLPPGTTATISPQSVQAGDKFTVTITASSTAAVAQNAELSIIGTPTAPNVPQPTLHLLLDVTPVGSVGWTNRTDFVPTRATPTAAVYDPAHQLIFATNQSWNRIDVISDATHSIVRSIPVRDPRGLDISFDGKTIWIATMSRVMYGLDTASLKMRRYVLPLAPLMLGWPPASWEGSKVYALADGTVLLLVEQSAGSGIAAVLIWNPVTNTVSILPPPSGAMSPQWGMIARSGDGWHIFSVASTSDETCFSYDVLSGTFSSPVQLTGYGLNAVANFDGSLIAVDDFSGFNLYNSSFGLLGPLPGGGGSYFFPNSPFMFGGVLFSRDGTKLYEELVTEPAMIATVDVATRRVSSLAPALPMIPVFVEMSPPFYVPVPFAIDDQGLLLGIVYGGIAFDDALANTNFVTNQPGTPTFLQHANVYSGPLAGGTTMGGFGNAFNIVPDVYFGKTKGTATLSQNTLQITSPPSAAPGPVNVKILFADGTEAFNPQFFTYGVAIQDALMSGAPPEGNVPGSLDAFGLPFDPSQDTVTIGGNRATVTSKVTQYPPLTGEQTAMSLAYTIPAGSPGWSDITVSNPNGTGTLPASLFYARSVKDYPTGDTQTFVLFDEKRNQLYISAGDHINVFSLSLNAYQTPITPPALGTTSQFQGLSLTPDKKYLLAANLKDSSLAVIDADSPGSAYAISVPQPTSFYNPSCANGPLYVASDKYGEAVVVTGAVVGIGCGPGGSSYLVNLANRTATSLLASGCVFGSAFVAPAGDGGTVVLSGWYSIGSALYFYDSVKHQCTNPVTLGMPYGVTPSADGKIVAVNTAFLDPSGTVLGRMNAPTALYRGARNSEITNYAPYQESALLNPVLNDSGSLYYWAFPNYFEIVDVQHGMLRMRFSLAESVSNVSGPIAIDADGEHVFLLTNKGLTVVDLGNAPVSIGWLSQTDVASGAQIQIRGSGFQAGMSASVGGLSAPVVQLDASTLQLVIPAATSGIQDIVLKNPDGTGYTLENAVTVH